MIRALNINEETAEVNTHGVIKDVLKIIAVKENPESLRVRLYGEFTAERLPELVRDRAVALSNKARRKTERSKLLLCSVVRCGWQ